jgi:hypothetical protein
MPSGFKIEQQDRDRYNKSVTDPTIPLDEIALRAAITSWAEKQKPGIQEWIYSWNAVLPKE